MDDEQLTPATADPKTVRKLGVFPQDKRINPDRLNDELKTALGEKLVSLKTGEMRKNPVVDAEGKPVLDDTGNPVTEQEGPFIYVIVTGEATEADLAAVEQLIKDHDPDQLSAVQQTEKEAIDAYTRLVEADFAAIRALKGEEKLDAVIAVLEDWQRLMKVRRG